MKLLPSFLVSCFLCLAAVGFAQQKVEVERGIKAEAVPSRALDWLREIAPGVKSQWYFEKTSGSKSFEAKFKKNGTRFSVEFDTTGVVEDVEIIKAWSSLSPEVQKGLEHYFETTYLRHKIRKIQEQVSGDEALIRDWMHGAQETPVTYRYEIEYYAKSEEGKALWEGLFDDRGVFISKRKVILRPTDNLNY